MSFLLAMLANTAVAGTPTEAPSRKGQPTLYCRNMVIGVSRSSDVSICRTKAAWADWESCQGPTRYCSPAQKAAMRAKYTTFALNEDSRVVCRIMRGTGSRLSSAKVCMPEREWQRMWDNGTETMHSLQDKFSTQADKLGQR